ncbi:MAG: ArsR family transcriptional regulator [Promethearchaeota archaeon]|nr:MAG: ArsR family transcriptional regulator [Candidatus Lokiarchaeota archaeon]
MSDDLTLLVIAFLEVISDPVRLEIIKLMKDGEITSKDVEEKLDISQPYASQQLKALTEEDLIKVRKEGTLKYYSIKHKEIFKVISVINSFVIEKERKKFSRLSKLDKLNSLK